MTEPSPAVVAEVEALLAHHDATARSVKPSGVGEIVEDTTTAEIAAALAELRARRNGTDPTE
jgi:hypothetical protein